MIFCMLHYPICIFITQRTTFYYYPSRCGFTCLKKPKGNRSKKKVTMFATANAIKAV